MKIVINTCYGGFGLSVAAHMRYIEVSGKDVPDYRIPRDDPHLTQIVETWGKESYGGFAKLKVIEIPDGTRWEIRDYDGVERVIEVGHEWY